MVYFGPPVDDDRLIEFGRQIGFELPTGFVYMLSRHNSFSLAGTEVYGLDASFRGRSLDQLNPSEHFETGNPMPLHLLPFSPDGAGNHYCLDLSKLEDGFCPVVFWQHDYEYDESDLPEVAHPSFAAWVEEWMIERILEDLNYDGYGK